MIASKIKALQVLRSKTAELERAIERELAALPSRYGYETTAEFLTAVRAAMDVRRGRPPGVGAGAKPAAKRGRRKRTKITEAIRGDVKRLVQAGKTGDDIAATLGISLPSVQNIKKALGMVRERKK